MLDLGIFKIYFYSFFILLGISIAIYIMYKEIKKNKINKDLFFDMAFYSIIIGILGARIYYVLFNIDYYYKYIIEIFQIWNGGLAIHGGLIAGLIFIYYFTKKHKLDALKILDIIVVGLLLGQAIGRWGNFFNQEAYGTMTTYSHLKSLPIPEFIIKGMYINGEYYTPTFLYESLWNMLGFIILILVRRFKYLKVGTLTGLYLVWYSLGRFFIEGLRLDSLMLGSIKIAQLVSILLFIVGTILIIYSIKKNKYYKS